MPRTFQDIIDHADELADRFEQMEPNGDGHRAALAQLRAAVKRRAAGEQAVADAVRYARADGLSWNAIGLTLGTTGEAARQRYGSSTKAAR